MLGIKQRVTTITAAGRQKGVNFIFCQSKLKKEKFFFCVALSRPALVSHEKLISLCNSLGNVNVTGWFFVLHTTTFKKAPFPDTYCTLGGSFSCDSVVMICKFLHFMFHSHDKRNCELTTVKLGIRVFPIESCFYVAHFFLSGILWKQQK